MHDHDQRFKTLIREFFGEFLQLFFADWAKRLDCSYVEWLDKEVFPDPPEGDRKVLDLVGKLPAREPIPGHAPDENTVWLALVHIEIESPEKAAPLRPRMFEYYTALRKRYGLPVLPIGLYLKVGLDGTGIDYHEEYFWELRPIRFEYLYVGLPALDGVEYVKQDNWLGWALASLMRIPKERVAELGAEALRRIVEAPLSQQKRFLLGECVYAYLPLDEDQKTKFNELLLTKNYAGVQAMNKTMFDEVREQSFEKGIEKGIGKGHCNMLRIVMEERFGTLSRTILERLKRMSDHDLEELARRVVRVETLAELGLEK